MALEQSINNYRPPVKVSDCRLYHSLFVQYPNLKPEIHFGESRGLSDAHLRG